jgi:GNAT superfamily N-acetyltransferase
MKEGGLRAALFHSRRADPRSARGAGRIALPAPDETRAMSDSEFLPAVGHTDQSTRVRPATRADIPFLVGANAAMAWETEEKQLDRELLTRGVTGVFDEPRRGFYLIAERDEAVAGSLLITYEWSDWRNGDWWWIQSVYVRPEDRRHGVFRSLYRHVEASARATSGVVGLRLFVEWENERAQRTYAALGMEQEHYHMYRTGFVPF